MRSQRRPARQERARELRRSEAASRSSIRPRRSRRTRRRRRRPAKKAEKKKARATGRRSSCRRSTCSPRRRRTSDRRSTRRSSATNAELLEKTLTDYGVTGKVEEIHPGPVVTTYEVSPVAGTKVTKVAGARRRPRARAREEGAHRRADPGQEPDRLRAPEREARPGEPARSRRGSRFQTLDVPLPVVLGRDIVGTPVYADLALDAARDRRRRDRRRQERRAQRHAHVAPLPAHAGRAAPAHDRSEGRRARALRSHPAHAPAGRHRHEAGGERAEVGGRRDGAALPALRRRRHEEHRHLQRLGRSACSAGEIKNPLRPRRSSAAISNDLRGGPVGAATTTPRASSSARDAPVSS